MDFDYKLLAKYLIEELSPEELEQLMAWRKLSEKNESIFEEVVKLKISHKFLEYNNSARIDTALGVIHKKIEKKTFKQRLFYWSRYAAVILFLASISFVLIKKTEEEKYLDILVKEGAEVKKVDLEDGTVVWLNSGSVIQIPSDFSAHSRRIKIEGEAYFDVVKNPSSPFLIETQQIDIRVLGTSLNVNTRHADNRIEAVLVSGSMELLDKQQQKVMYSMSPGEKVSYTPSSHRLSIEEIDINVSTAWHLRQMIFENTTLRDIVNKLSMLFDININLESKRLADRRYRCVINKEETLTEILEHLKYMTPIEYVIDGNEVFIKE